MSTYDSYETVEVPRRHRSHSHSTHTHRHRERRDRDRDDYDEPRYVETKETYVSRAPPAIVPEAPYSPTYNAPYGARTTELIRRPMREDSDLSVQEITRDFPPPAGGPIAYVQQHRSVVRDDRYGPVRSRSAERDSQYGAYLGDPRRSDRDVRGSDRRSRQIAVAHEETIQPRRRSLSRNQKILAAVGGAALAVGGKELFDRRGDLKHAPANRNMLATAAVGAAGAFAAYEGTEIAYKRFGGKEEVKKKKYTAVADENGNVAEYYSSGTDDEKRPKTSRRKSIVEGAMALAGLGAAKAAISGHGKDRSRGGDYSDDSYDGRRSTRSRRGSSHNDGAAKFQQAAKAALLAGATEAFRVRNEPGGWGGAKGKRILTAAIGASAIDAAADRNPDSKSKRHILEAVIGGLAGNRLVNGSRKEIDEDDDGRSIKGGRSRSRARSKSRGPGGAGGLAALATAGLGALAAKKMVDRSRSRSRGGDRDRRRDRSSSSDAPRDKRRRSKSVTDFARKGLAAIGLGEAVHHETRDRSRSRDDRRRGDTVVEDTYVSHKGGSRRDRDRGIDDDYEGGGGRSRGGVYGNPDYNDSRGSNVGSSRRGGGEVARRGGAGEVSQRGGDGARARDGRKNRRVAEGKESSDSSSDLGSSSGDEKRAKKMKGKQILTAGLAGVATIHAAHNVYQSVEKRQARKKAVEEGEMTPEEAHKLKTKARLQDVASIGIAALGIKGAYSEWKEMKEMRDECKEFETKKEERHRKRMERQSGQKGGRNGKPNGDAAVTTRPPNRRLQSASHPNLRSSYDAGPTYYDDNPYSAGGLPPPPVGYGYR